MMTVRATSIPGCIELQLPRFEDDRGVLVKDFQRSAFEDLKLPSGFVEQFHSRSRLGVVRGMHFQRPPHQFHKLVTCVAGAAWDVVVDLRSGSPTDRQHAVIGLSADRANAVVIPPGCGHGFLSLAEGTVLSYWVTAEHHPDHDDGVHWDSAGIPWPLETDPIVSRRDEALTRLSDFDSPFVFEG